MNPVLTAGQGAGILVEAHGLNQRLDEHGGFLTHQVRTEQLAVVLARDELAQANLIFHGPAVGGIAEVLGLDGNLESFASGSLAGLLLGHANNGDLRVAEDRARHVTVIARTQILGVAEVVLHDARLVVGHVLELVAAGDIA